MVHTGTGHARGQMEEPRGMLAAGENRIAAVDKAARKAATGEGMMLLGKRGPASLITGRPVGRERGQRASELTTVEGERHTKRGLSGSLSNTQWVFSILFLGSTPGNRDMGRNISISLDSG